MAKSPSPLVCILAYNPLCLFEYAIALEVFGLPRPEFDHWYDFDIVPVNQQPIHGIGHVQINAKTDLKRLLEASLIIVPGWAGEVSAELKATLREAIEKGVRIATICSGVFLPAACGLLDGKTATTHWRYTEKLQQQYPHIHVNSDVLYIDEGSVLTSAGSAAGIDLCLYIVRQDFGSAVANTVAKRLVLPAHREGKQAQFVPRPSPKYSNGFSPMLDTIRASLDEPWSIERMAQQATLSTRTLLRRFKETTGETPANWLLQERLARVRELLETTELNVEQVALASGFNSPALLRHHFKRAFKLSPLRYRQQFVSS
jgi:AraC family transcriptional activator FtrA